MSATAEIIAFTKRCISCGESKERAAFSRASNRKDGLLSHCKPCDSRIRMARFRMDPAATAAAREARRARQKKPENNSRHFLNYVKRHFGITLDDARNIFRAQFGMCANRACGKELSFDVRGHDLKRAVIDHCHTSGKVRGILCHRCNTAAGVFEKNRNRFVGLFEYLEHSVA